MLSYFIIGVLIFTVFSYTLINIYSKKEVEEVNKISQNAIYQSYYTADILLTNIYYNFFQMFANNLDKDIVNGLYASELDQYSISDVILKLSHQELSNPLIRSIYVYNAKAGIVIYHISQDHGSFAPIREFFDKDIVNILKNPSPHNMNSFFTRQAHYVIKEREVKENLITLIFANISPNKRIEEALIVNLDQSILQQMVTNGKIGDLNQVFIIYENGDVITHSDPSMLHKNIYHESYIKTILESRNKNGYFTDKIDGKDSLVTYVKADRLKWVFVGIGEYNRLLSTFTSIQRTIIILTILFVVIGLIIAIFFGSSIYRPFHKLLQDIRKRYNSKKEPDSLSVYDYIKYTFDELVEEVDKYKLDAHQLLNEKKKIFLQRLVSGDIDHQLSKRSYFKEYGLKFRHPYFLVIVLKIDAFEDQLSVRWSNDSRLFKFAVLNIACEILSDSYIVEGVDNGTDYVSLILNMQDSDEQSIISKLRMIQESVEEYLMASITIGVGSVVQGIESINISFENAITALSYRVVYGIKSIIQYEDIVDRAENHYKYPYDVEEQITDAIKQYDKEEFKICLDRFFELISKTNIDEILMFVTQFVMTLIRTINGIKGTKTENSEYNFRTIYSKLISYETLEDMKNYLYRLSSNFIEIVCNDPERNNKLKIAEKIKDYIHEHYADQNICTNVIADYMELSSNYVRVIFKEIMDISISDYITKCRMDHARRLLTETDHTVKEISEKVGYIDNNKYFYVVFKKYFGKTPGEMRNEF